MRRIVTGHDSDGRAVVTSDSSITGQELVPGAVQFAVIWKTLSSPADNNDAVDHAGEPGGLAQSGGSVLRIVDMAPGNRSPLHRTKSLDYGIVLSGEVDLELDDGRLIHLNPEDIVVQRGTIHAWINRGKTIARMAFVLLDATPVTAGGKILEPLLHGIAPGRDR